MENPFILKIKQIILDHLDDEKFGVNELASKIGMSKSQTFRKVKSLTNKSINQFIKETRLKEAAKLILNTDLHASEISYKTGFSSPSYFNKCFRKYYGLTPGEYKEKYNENLPINGFEQVPSHTGIKKYQVVFYTLVAVLLLFGIISIFKSQGTKVNANPSEVSIAVLYFEDYSPEADIEWFCNGITEEIINKLSGIKGLRVTSRTSVKQFRNSNKSIPEIAKILGVDYIIEGSVRKDYDSIRITTQLINLKDKHEWSSNYDESFENSLKLQNEVSKLIVNKLNITLSREEEKSIANVPTDSLKAFQLFSEGLSFADQRVIENLEGLKFIHPNGIKNLKKSIALFQQAIDIDINYAEAYAEKAFNLELLNPQDSIFDTEDKHIKVNSLLDKALEINPNISRVYLTKGIIQGYNHGNWKKAEEYFKKAIELKPNDATNQHYYALYFALKTESDFKKALEHINIAQSLNPHSASINYDKITFLIKNDKIIEAEEFYKYNNSFFTDNLKLKTEIRLLKAKAKKVSLEKKDWTEALNFYHNEIEKDPKNAEIYRLLAEAYDEILNDAPNFLKYAEIAKELNTREYIFRRTYGFALLKNKRYEVALKLVQKGKSRAPLYTGYYYTGNYEKAQDILDEYSGIFDLNIDQAVLYAQQNKAKETYQILNKGVLANFEKARVFAILEERDSMYYYINKEKDVYIIRYFNSYFEVDPYRKEGRFKALLKKHYLPLTHWNK